MKKIFLAILLGIVPASAHAVNQYFGVSYDRVAGTATKRVSGTYGVAASSATYNTYTILLDGTSGEVNATGQMTVGAAASKSTFTAAGSLLTDDATLAGDLSAVDAVLSGTLNVDGESTFGADGTKSTFTAAGLLGVHDTVSTDGELQVNGTGVSWFLGNLGLDTVVPTQKLHLSSGTLYIDGNASTSIQTSGSIKPIVDAGIDIGDAAHRIASAYLAGVLAADGSAATPSFRFINDTNTGIRRPGNDVLSFVTNSADRFVLTTTSASVLGILAVSGETHLAGSVGVGTTNPGSLLDVYRDDAATASQFDVEQDGAGDAAMSFTITGTNTWMIGIDNSAADNLTFSKDSAGLQNNPFMVIETGGNVGINTTSPNRTLEVKGIIRSTSSTSEAQIELFTNSDAWVIQADAASGNLEINGTSATGGATNILNIAHTSGNVGIGTTSPAGKLHLYKSGGAHDLIMQMERNSTSGQTLTFRQARVGPSISVHNDVIARIYANPYDGTDYANSASYIELGVDGNVAENVTPGYIDFYTNNGSVPTHAVHISSSQQMGIGTIDPQGELDVEGSAHFGDAGTKSTFTATGFFTPHAFVFPSAAAIEGTITSTYLGQAIQNTTTVGEVCVSTTAGVNDAWMICDGSAACSN